LHVEVLLTQKHDFGSLGLFYCPHPIWPAEITWGAEGRSYTKDLSEITMLMTQPKNVVNNKYCHELSLVARPVSYQK